MSDRLHSGTAGAAFAAVVAATISGVTGSVYHGELSIQNTHATDPLLILSPHAQDETATYYVSLPAGASTTLKVTELDQIKLKGNGVTYNIQYQLVVRAK